MLFLKLFDNWIGVAEKKERYWVDGKWKRRRVLSRRQVKGLLELVKRGEVVERGEGYVVYKVEV